MRSLAIECLPKDLPEILTVDVSALKIGDSIHVRDIKLPAGVVARTNTDLTVFAVAAPIAEEVAPVATEVAAEPEVIKEKKVEGAAAPGAEKEGAKPEKKEGAKPEKGEKK
jgi:large subunit ribosomal protein L25